MRGLLLAVLLFVACSRSGPHVLDGAGATLPYPLYARWSSEYARVDGSVRVNYQPLGSGAGVRQLSDGVIDFGATDEPMSDEQMKQTPGVVHLPMTIGAVVVTYNVPGIKELKLTPDVLADVFRGAIDRWDDPKLQIEPRVAEKITVVHRAEGSGTSATFAAFLSRTSEAWRTSVGTGIAPHFPVGVGARGNDGVAAYVKSTPYSIGYLELAYARQAGLPVALVRNRGGNYVPPTLDALERAARAALPRLPEDLRLSIVDADDPAAYPLAALSFFLLPQDAKARPKAEALGRFVWWALHDGQRLAAELDYAPLPPELVVHAERVAKSLRAEGKPLMIASGASGS